MFWFEHLGRFIVPPQTALLSYGYELLDHAPVREGGGWSGLAFFCWRTWTRMWLSQKGTWKRDNRLKRLQSMVVAVA